MRYEEREALRLHVKLPAFRRRLARAEDVLRRANDLGRLVVASSWGKDSVVLCDLASRTLGAIPIMHIASSYRLPGWEGVAAHFCERTRVHDIAPARGLQEMIEWLKDVGLPHERTRAAQGNVVAVMKKDVGASWCIEHGFRVQALGMRAEENQRTRGRLFRARGLIYEARGVMMANPLGAWSSMDVWGYIAAHGLPYHPMYDCETHGFTRHTLRNAGWLSTDGAHRGRIAWLRAHYLSQYQELKTQFPQVAMYG